MKRFLILSLTLAFLAGCTDESTNDDVCIDYKLEDVVSVVDRPDTPAGTFAFDVSFQVDNGCGDFYAFNEQTVGNTKTIRVSTKYEGCICTQDMAILTETYQFSPELPGTYTINFVMADGTIVTRTVVKP